MAEALGAHERSRIERSNLSLPYESRPSLAGNGGLSALYERQVVGRGRRRWLLAPLSGLTLAVTQGISLVFWLDFPLFGLASEPFGSGFAIPFAVAGLVGAGFAGFRRNFKVAIVGAILSIFSVGPLGIGSIGGLAASAMILAAGDESFR